jgi:hypothetical protein
MKAIFGSMNLVSSTTTPHYWTGKYPYTTVPVQAYCSFSGRIKAQVPTFVIDDEAHETEARRCDIHKRASEMHEGANET